MKHTLEVKAIVPVAPRRRKTFREWPLHLMLLPAVALVILFSSQDYSILSDAAGKQKLQAQALDAVRVAARAR